MADRSDQNAAGQGNGRSGTSRRGFASMSPERQREIASKGGRAAHAKGTAHEWTTEEAREAGRKGGEVVSRDRAHMAAIGREGGGARSSRASRNTPQNNEAQDDGAGERENGEARTTDTTRGATASQ